MTAYKIGVGDFAVSNQVLCQDTQYTEDAFCSRLSDCKSQQIYTFATAVVSRRERNRMHAKMTRDRKKCFIASLKRVISRLEEENQELRVTLERHRADERSRANIAQKKANPVFSSSFTSGAAYQGKSSFSSGAVYGGNSSSSMFNGSMYTVG